MTAQIESFRIRAGDAPVVMPAPLHLHHGPEVREALDVHRQRDRVIKRLGTIIVVLLVVLAYCLEWARVRGL